MAPAVMHVLRRSTADSAVDTVAIVIGLERRELPFEVEQIPEQHLVKHVHPGMFGPGARFSLVTEPAPSTARDCRRRDLHPVAARTFVVSYWAAMRWAFAESGSEKMMIADVPLPPKKPDTTPEVVATYCLPPIS